MAPGDRAVTSSSWFQEDPLRWDREGGGGRETGQGVERSKQEHSEGPRRLLAGLVYKTKSSSVRLSYVETLVQTK